jgi:acetyltransferase-like isoleucine patch superfamily enzyme
LNTLWNLEGSTGFPKPIGQTGFSLASLENAIILPVGPKRARNWLVFLGGLPRKLSTNIDFDKNCAGNVMIFAGKYGYPESIHFQGSNNTLYWGPNITWPAAVNVRFSSNRQLLFWGEGSTSNGTVVILEGDERRTLIGDDCMFALNTRIYTSDLHAIVDMTAQTWINPPQDVLIHSHVWLGQDSLILKGVTIGSGSIVGAKSLVTKSIIPNGLVGGIPAKLLKSNVRWERTRQPGLKFDSEDLYELESSR